MADLDSVFISTVETAVSTAVAQNKPLIVFNTDSSQESNKWVDGLLSEELLRLISEKSVALKLVIDSTQFALFEQIFPNVIIPSFYCIKVAAILDIIHGDLEQEEFTNRITKVLNNEAVAQNTAPSAPQPEIISSDVNENQQLSDREASTPSRSSVQTPSSSQAPSVQSSAPTPQPSSRTQTPTRGNGKRDYRTLKEEAAELTARKYKEEQLKKKQREREERERVRRLLKADEEERRLNERHKQAERERQRRLSNDEEAKDDVKIDEILNENQALKNNVRDRRPSSSLVCALSIRLLDGSSLRHEFKTTDTLNDVRKWLDENRTDSDDPYCFHRTIPRATFGVTEEEKSLESLELTPRSALILKPFSSYANAYNSSGNISSKSSQGGLFSRVFGGISSFWYGDQSGRALNSQEDRAGSDSIEEDDDLIDPVSPISSSYVSPAPTPRNEPETRLDLLHPSALSLNLNLDQVQRPASPQLNTQEHPKLDTPTSLSRISSQSRIRTLNSSESDDRLTYNGNHINLEDDSKKK